MGEFLKDRLPDPISYFESQGLKLHGSGKWRTTSCYFHGGSDSMRINTDSGAFVCMAGCGARGGDVLAYHMAGNCLGFIAAAIALGAWKEDGIKTKPQRPKQLPATAAIQVLAFESSLIAIAAGNLGYGVILTDEDRMRLIVASHRIQHISEMFA